MNSFLFKFLPVLSTYTHSTGQINYHSMHASANEVDRNFRDMKYTTTPFTTTQSSNTGTTQKLNQSKISTVASITASNHTGGKDKTMHTSDKVDLRELKRICPGAKSYPRSQSELVAFRVNVSDCSEPVRDLRVLRGVVYGICKISSFCQYLVQVPRGMFAYARWHIPYRITLNYKWRMLFYNRWGQPLSLPSHEADGYSDRGYLSSTNQLHVFHYNNAKLRIYFKAVRPRDMFTVVNTSRYEGYITATIMEVYCYDNVDFCGRLKAPKDHIIMLSFKTIDLDLVSKWLASFYLNANQKVRFSLNRLRSYHIATIFNTDQIRLCFTLTSHSKGDPDGVYNRCMKNTNAIFVSLKQQRASKTQQRYVQLQCRLLLDIPKTSEL